MNLVNELQVSAERDDVLTVLRKAKRLASKLDVTEINDWLRCEQGGYGDNDPIPTYRVVNAQVVYNTNGPIPVGWNMTMRGIVDFPGNISIDRAIGDSVSELIAMANEVSQRDHGWYMTMPESDATRYLRSMMHNLIANQVSFLFRLNLGQMLAIPEAVKDRVLDWACELERRGVLGENMTFDEREKQIAHSITWNINNCTVEQLNNMGNNFRSIGNE